MRCPVKPTIAIRPLVLRPLVIRPLVILLLAVLRSTAVRAQSDPLRGLDGYIQHALQAWQVPGLAIAVVKNDSVVLAKGYGVRELGKVGAVDERTVFAIGSSTKAFTAAAIGMLVDEGRVQWDDRATKNLPDFELYDPYTTRELTVRDLLTHRSGLPGGNQLWYGTDFDRAEILRRVRYLTPASSLRSTFGYNNLMYLAAGQVVASVTGKTWDQFISERLFAPLGMTGSNTTIRDLQGRENVATPHLKVDGRVIPIAWRKVDNIAPAGSINSNVVDMAQWVRLQLGEGTYLGRRLLRPGTVREMHTPQTVIRPDPRRRETNPDGHFWAYGMGWFLEDFRGRTILQHGGNIDGMSAMVGLMPEEHLGMVVLTNLNGTELTTAIMFRVFDAYTGATRDWSTKLLAQADSAASLSERQRRKIEEARVPGTAPSLPLGRYAGTYHNRIYGDLNIALEQGRLVARRAAGFEGELEHWNFDTFRFAWRHDPKLGKQGFITFVLGPQGEIESAKVRDFIDLNADFTHVVEGSSVTTGR
jgi:CubicO group peptidase (beta-lactamase class C family)